MDKVTGAHLISALMGKKGIVPDQYLARAIGTAIYDVSTTKSGLVSKTLIDDYGFRSSSFCEEHYHSRQRVGARIVEDNPSLNDIIKILEECTKVHLVTSEENIRLSPFQNGADTKHKNWQEQYDLAGIELVSDKGTAPVYFYKTCVINNQSYANIEEASKATNLTWDEIRRRCSSKAKKWSSYERLQ
jgi:hypothetical protein